MTRMKPHSMAALAAVFAGLLAGCAGPEVKEEKAAVEERAVTPPPAPPAEPAAETKPVQPPAVTVSPLKDPANILSKRSVYFDYDSAAVKDEYKPMLEAHAKYLRENRNTKVTVQGNTDERGSREYNVALGQSRADSVKKVLGVLGVTDLQMETVSYGEEKPKAEGHDEEAWKQNRRADIVYQGE